MNPDVDDHIRRLWRHRGTTVPGPRRGPRPQLDLDDILDAAITLADAEGLEAVSTRSVAARWSGPAISRSVRSARTRASASSAVSRSGRVR